MELWGRAPKKKIYTNKGRPAYNEQKIQHNQMNINFYMLKEVKVTLVKPKIAFTKTTLTRHS